MINWQWSSFDDLDQVSWHLIGWSEGTYKKKIIAYLRVVFPGKKFTEPSIGRVLVIPESRKQGLGKKLTAEAIARIAVEYPNSTIRISAQQYLEKFYSALGFRTVSKPYKEDGIPHIEMLR